MAAFGVFFLSASLLAAGPVVEVEEVVATCRPPGNGAGPLWCYGAPLLVRQDDKVFVSIMETGIGVPPLSNTRWRLYERDDRGWTLLHQPNGFRNREPCPIVSLETDHLALSVNPSLEPPGTQYGRCDPHLLRFDTRHPELVPRTLRPPWPGTAHFTDHSYRGIAADFARGELLVLNIDATTSAQHWAFGLADGTFPRIGIISFPVRGCYAQVALRNRTAHVMAVGDIVEPNKTWQAFKKQKTGREWDYVFRRLFYTWTPDIARVDFAAPAEIDSVEATGGHITNLDVWISPEGTAHLLYLKTNLNHLLRDQFFPGQEIVTTLEHVAMHDGQVARRTTLQKGGEKARQTCQYARFHVTEDGTLWVVDRVSGARADGSPLQENQVFAIRPAVAEIMPVSLGLKTPFSTFFTAAERGGNRPSNLLDLFGTGADAETLRYARVRIR
jgi:hypothetical protein